MKTRPGALWLAFGAIALAGCGRGRREVPVHREVASPAHLQDVARLTGIVEPVVQVELRSEVAGQIDSIFVAEGDTLREGQLVALVDAEKLEKERGQQQIQVRQAELRLRQAQRDLARHEELKATGTISDDELEDFRLAAQQAELDLEAARYALGLTETDLSRTRIRSPIGGVLITLDVEKGEVVSSVTQGVSGGTLVGTVADLSRMQVEVEVGELDWPRLRRGQRVALRSEAVPRPLEGVVRFVGSSARSSSSSDDLRVFPMEIEFTKDVGAIAPGMTVDAEVVLLEKDARVTLPVDAVGTSGGRSYVHLQRGAASDSVEVRTGATDFRRVEILEGLDVGDTVVVRSAAAQAASGGSRRGPGGGPPP